MRLDAGANVFESSDVSEVGEFSLHTDVDDTPTADARIYVDLEAAPFSISDDDVVRIKFKWRHIATVGTAAWYAYLASSNDGTNNQMGVVTWTSNTFVTIVYYWTHSANYQYLVFMENAGTNNGGIYLDDYSVKTVTFT